jgi:hypothetical protein
MPTEQARGEGQTMRSNVAGTLNRFFSPAPVAGVASFIPPLLMSAWKLISPEYEGSAASEAAVWNTPCFAVMFCVAYGLGWIIDRVASRIADRLPRDETALERLDRIRSISLIAAAGVGLATGVPLAGYVLSPGP